MDVMPSVNSRFAGQPAGTPPSQNRNSYRRRVGAICENLPTRPPAPLDKLLNQTSNYEPLAQIDDGALSETTRRRSLRYGGLPAVHVREAPEFQRKFVRCPAPG